MTNKEAKERIDNMISYLGQLDDDGEEEKDLEALRTAIKALEQSEWIPVSERLPESSGVYIVSRWFDDGCEKAILTDACYFDGTSTWHNDNRINHGREYIDAKIVAWKPLPEPYKEKEE